MPTLMSHAVVPLAIGLALGPKHITKPVLIAGVVLAMLPDVDVVAFLLNIDYAHQFGHRGASHSLFAALVMGGLVSALMPRARALGPCLFLIASMMSHALLDTLTDGGLGAALLWPFDHSRYFAPVTPITVSPIAHHFFSREGLYTLASELLWIWLPTGLAFALLRRSKLV